MPDTHKPIIAVIGGNQCSKDESELAYQVGKLIAQQGGLLVCGGRSGIMEAAAKGAVEASGNTIGILPGDETAEANAYITIPVATGMGIGRNIVIIRTADAVVAVGGKYGTLSEIAHALQLGKPVFALGSWDAIDGVIGCKSAQQAVENAFRSVSDGL